MLVSALHDDLHFSSPEWFTSADPTSPSFHGALLAFSRLPPLWELAGAHLNRTHARTLPLKLKSARIRNFKRFVDLTIADLPPEARLVVLLGPNGCGKSSLFDAFQRRGIM